MEVKLVYQKDDNMVVLEERDLEELDQFTYNTFSSEAELINDARYKDKIIDVGFDGKVSILYENKDIPFKGIELYAYAGNDPFIVNHTLPVLFGNSKTAPDKKEFIQYIRNNISEGEDIRWFHDIIRPALTSEEHLLHCIGVIKQTYTTCFRGIDRFLTDVYKDEDGYFWSRFYLDTINKRFENKKTAKCSMTSVQYVKK